MSLESRVSSGDCQSISCNTAFSWVSSVGRGRAPFTVNVCQTSETDNSDERSRSTSYVSKWTVDDPTRMYLEPDEDRVVACLEARIANVSGYSIHHHEAIQVYRRSKVDKIVRNSGSRGSEHPDANLWPEWQPYDTSPTMISQFPDYEQVQDGVQWRARPFSRETR